MITCVIIVIPNLCCCPFCIHQRGIWQRATQDQRKEGLMLWAVADGTVHSVSLNHTVSSSTWITYWDMSARSISPSKFYMSDNTTWGFIKYWFCFSKRFLYVCLYALCVGLCVSLCNSSRLINCLFAFSGLRWGGFELHFTNQVSSGWRLSRVSVLEYPAGSEM